MLLSISIVWKETFSHDAYKLYLQYPFGIVIVQINII